MMYQLIFHLQIMKTQIFITRKVKVKLHIITGTIQNTIKSVLM